MMPPATQSLSCVDVNAQDGFYDEQSAFFENVQKASRLVFPIFYTLGAYLRDCFYLCLNGALSERLKADVEFSALFAKAFFTADQTAFQPVDTFPCFNEVRNMFDVTSCPVEVKCSDMTYRFNIQVIESKVAVNGTKLRLFLFSFYGNEQCQKNQKWEPWTPATMAELEVGPTLVLKALKREGIVIDLLHAFSIGGIAIEGFKFLGEDPDQILPSQMIFDRIITSSYKVAAQCYPWMSKVLSCLAWLANWHVDTEQAIQQLAPSWKGKEIIEITAKYDRFFSGKARHDPSFHQHVRSQGIKVRTYAMYAPPFSEPEQHALSWHNILHNPAAKSEDFFKMEMLQSLSSVMIDKVYTSKTHKRSKTKPKNCLIIGGNTQDQHSMLLSTYVNILAPFCRKYWDEIEQRENQRLEAS